MQLKRTAVHEGAVAALSGFCKSWSLLSNFAPGPPDCAVPCVFCSEHMQHKQLYWSLIPQLPSSVPDTAVLQD